MQKCVCTVSWKNLNRFGTIDMRTFKINNERSVDPDPKTIEKHKDFQRFYHDYERLTKRSKRPIYQDPKLYLLLVLIGIILFLIFGEGYY